MKRLLLLSLCFLASNSLLGASTEGSHSTFEFKPTGDQIVSRVATMMHFGRENSSIPDRIAIKCDVYLEDSRTVKLPLGWDVKHVHWSPSGEKLLLLGAKSFAVLNIGLLPSDSMDMITSSLRIGGEVSLVDGVFSPDQSKVVLVADSGIVIVASVDGDSIEVLSKGSLPEGFPHYLYDRLFWGLSGITYMDKEQKIWRALV